MKGGVGILTHRLALLAGRQAEADREAQQQAARESVFDMGAPTNRSKAKGY